MNILNKKVMATLLVATTGLFGLASAQTAAVKGTVDVRLTILESCKIDGGEIVPGADNKLGVLDFGTHKLGATGVQSAGSGNDSTTTGLSINVECTADYPNFKIRLVDSKNTGYSLSGEDRKLIHEKDSGQEVAYAVLTEDQTVIKDGDLVSQKPIKANAKTEYIMHAKATLVGQETAGTYSDVLNLEITF